MLPPPASMQCWEIRENVCAVSYAVSEATIKLSGIGQWIFTFVHFCFLLYLHLFNMAVMCGGGKFKAVRKVMLHELC